MRPTDPNYDAIWQEIVESDLSGVYAAEVYWLALTIVSRLDDVFASAPQPNEIRL